MKTISRVDTFCRNQLFLYLSVIHLLQLVTFMCLPSRVGMPLNQITKPSILVADYLYNLSIQATQLVT